MSLGTPIIPLVITVHLGTPKSNARNVTLPFRDYIKNVASSEIYPTWPDSALRANIYAITSFALNRVYTEYYRAQGFPFDITSSTSYDQAFVDGRDIFANISRLVDELYNDYIVRRGHVEPMFASYCNGTTATCAGLSQWGSYYLASQGYTPYRILQYYYGSDIDLVFDAPEGPVYPSFPGRLLRRGSAGEEVRTLQMRLRRISRNFPSVPAVEVNTGVFDGPTDAAVRAFQRTFGLTPDGVVGPNTWNRAITIFNAVARLNELDSQGVTLFEATSLYAVNLRPGDHGFDVRALQYYLDFIARFYPSMGSVAADGVFGPDTERALREFQRLYGLTVDGVAGRATHNALLEAYTALYNSLPPEDARPFYPNYAFSEGDTGEKVRLLQTMLAALSQRIPGLQPLIPDGYNHLCPLLPEKRKRTTFAVPCLCQAAISP
ncbi:MAG: peptidoglycan-binding protein [Firmicutes bacterium]|nr:peptidoglycan-binding protein [Bacillota bacterium]